MRPGVFAAAAWLAIGLGSATAQPAAPRLVAVALDPFVTRGPGVLVRLRLTTRADASPLTGARIVSAHAVSARGALVSATGVSAGGDGVYTIRAALEQPGAWTVEITVAVFDRSPATTSASVSVVDGAPAPLHAEPVGPAAPSVSAPDSLATTPALAPAVPPQL